MSDTATSRALAPTNSALAWMDLYEVEADQPTPPRSKTATDRWWDRMGGPCWDGDLPYVSRPRN